MSRKHNVKKNRSPSGYAERLSARGETPSTVRMKFIDRRGRKHDTVDNMLKSAKPEDDVRDV